MKIYLMECNFDFHGETDNHINYEVMEKYVKPLVNKIRQYKQTYKITEVYERDIYSIPKEYKDIIEKLTKVKIISVEE